VIELGARDFFRKELELLNPFHPSEVPVKRAQWKMTGIPGGMKQQTIRKSESRSRTEQFQGRCHDLGVLQN
jgi:hypothetical protein